jgi:hypothetical protein
VRQLTLIGDEQLQFTDAGDYATKATLRPMARPT